MNYKLLTGPFEGNVIEEGIPILDVPFEELDIDLQARILDWAEMLRLCISDLDLLKEDYESSWEDEETDAAIDLIPVSEW